MKARGTCTLRPLSGRSCAVPASSAGEPPPGVVERRIGRRIVRHVPDRQAGKLFQPEIGARIEPHHVHVLVQHVG